MSPEPNLNLSDDQIRDYRENGYLTIESFTTVAELEWMREIYDRLFSERAGRERGDEFDLAGPDIDGEVQRLPQILSPSNHAPKLKETLAFANADAIAKQILGECGSCAGDHAILKPARYGSETPWHQDEAYWDPSLDYDSFSVWIPLDGATIESGCLHFVPGSHLGEVCEHRPIGGDPCVHGLEAVEPTVTGAIPCPLAPGSATIHHNRTLHYAGPNHTDQHRRAYILMCGSQATPRATPRSFPWKEIQKTERARRAQSAQQKESKNEN